MSSGVVKVERVQLGVRIEKNLVKVLKGLAEFNDETLGELLEKIVLHSFDPVPGDEGESCASPHSKRELAAIDNLRTVYGVSTDPHAAHFFAQEARVEEADEAELRRSRRADREGSA